MSSIRVQLQQFEGPLDLLLYLIRKEEMDIFNINIVEITKQYLDFIKLMKEFDLEVAGDFIAMASTLIQIKSKMLLPQYDENGEIIENEDPRKELVQKLLEYEKFKEASKALYERPLLNRDVWARGFRERLDVPNDEIELEENALFSLIASYRKSMKALYKKVHKVNVKLQSIASRILEMSTKLIPGTTVRMIDILTHDIAERVERSRHALITFLSLLELGKMGYVGLYQSETYGDIHIQTKKTIEGDVVSRVEEYGSINADQVADNLFEKSIKLAEEELEMIENEDAALTSVAQSSGEQLNFLEQDLSPLEVEGSATDEELLAAEMELNLEPATAMATMDPQILEESVFEPAGASLQESTSFELNETSNPSASEQAKESPVESEDDLMAHESVEDAIQEPEETLNVNPLVMTAESVQSGQSDDIVALTEEAVTENASEILAPEESEPEASQPETLAQFEAESNEGEELNNIEDEVKPYIEPSIQADFEKSELDALMDDENTTLVSNDMSTPEDSSDVHQMEMPSDAAETQSSEDGSQIASTTQDESENNVIDNQEPPNQEPEQV